MTGPKWMLAATMSALIATAPVEADTFGAVVATEDRAELLVSHEADRRRDGALAGRLLLLLLGARDMKTGSTPPDTRTRLGADRFGDLETGLQAVALGDPGYRAPLAGVAAVLGRDPDLLTQRLAALARRIGVTGTDISIERGPNGAPVFSGQTTLRDLARIAAAFARLPEHREAVFGPATGFSEIDIWVTHDDLCVISRQGDASLRPYVAAMAGAPSRQDCFAAATRNIAAQDARLAR